MDVKHKLQHSDEPPTKKIRIEAPASPAASQMSDAAFDDDDLYDSPARPSTARAIPLDCRSAESPVGRTKKESPGLLPGLALLTSPPPDSLPTIGKREDAGDFSEDENNEDIDNEDLYEPSIHGELDVEANGSSATIAPAPELVEAPSIPLETHAQGTSLSLDANALFLATQANTSTKTMRSPSEPGLIEAGVASGGIGGTTNVQSAENRDETDEATDTGDIKLADGQHAEENKATTEAIPTSKDEAPGPESSNKIEGSESSIKMEDGAALGKAPVSISESERHFLELAEANKNNEQAEWELDSSDAQDTDSSSDSSDSSDESGAEDYVLMDPREQARMLMQEEGGSDDERAPKKFVPPRTVNEKPEIRVEKPSVVITPEMEILELGAAEAIVETTLLVRGKTTGNTQVLENGSVLCLENRGVIGAVAETLGRVEEPRYSVAFTNAAEIADLGITVGTKIFYAPVHAQYVFTKSLQKLKGSDASNQHDEEVGDDEIEFSDDEAEAEHKRMIKLAKKGARPDAAPGRPTRNGSPHLPPLNKSWPTENTEYPEVPMKYDDDEEEDSGLYKPLARPANFMAANIPPRPPMQNRNGRGNSDRGRPDRGRGGRGDRGGDRGARGDRARGGDRGRGRGRGGSKEERGGAERHRNGRGGAQTFQASPPPQANPALPSPNQALPSLPPMSYNQGQTFNANSRALPPSHNTMPAQQVAYPQQQGYWPPQQQASYNMPHNYNIPPAGSYVNPNFFRNQQQNQYPSPQFQQQQYPQAPFSNSGLPQYPMAQYQAMMFGQQNTAPFQQQQPQQPGQQGNNQGYDPSRPWMP